MPIDDKVSAAGMAELGAASSGLMNKLAGVAETAERVAVGMTAVHTITASTIRGFKMLTGSAGKLSGAVKNLRREWASNVGVSEDAAVATIGVARALQLTTRAASIATAEYVKQSKALPKVNTAYRVLMKSAITYNKVQQDAAVIAERYGQSVEEVQSVMSELRSTIRLDKDTEVGRKNLARMTQEVMALNAAMGVDASQTIGLYNTLIFGMGKSASNASRDLISMYSVVNEFNEENRGKELWYDDFTKGVLEAAQGTNALAVDMGALSNVFVTAFEKSENLVNSYTRQLDVANAFGKLVTGGPEWLKIKTGESLLELALGSPEEFAAIASTLDAGVQNQLQQVIAGVQKGTVHRVEAAEALDQALAGTQTGIIARLKEMEKVIQGNVAGASILAEQLGIEDITVAIAMNELMQSGDLETAAAEFTSMNESTLSFTEALRSSGPVFSRLQNAAGAISTHLKAIPAIGRGFEILLEGTSKLFSSSKFLLALAGMVAFNKLVIIFRTFYDASKFLSMALAAGTKAFGYLADQINKAGSLLGGLKMIIIDAFNAVFGRLIHGTALRTIDIASHAESPLLLGGPTGMPGGGKTSKGGRGKRMLGAATATSRGGLLASTAIRGLLMSFVSLSVFQAFAQSPTSGEIGAYADEAAKSSKFSAFANTVGSVFSIMLPTLLLAGIEKFIFGGGGIRAMSKLPQMFGKSGGTMGRAAASTGSKAIASSRLLGTAVPVAQTAITGAGTTAGLGVAATAAAFAALLAVVVALTAVYFKFKDNTVVWYAAMVGLLGPIAQFHAVIMSLYNALKFLWEQTSRLIEPAMELASALGDFLSIFWPFVKAFLIFGAALVNWPFLAIGAALYGILKVLGFFTVGFFKIAKFLITLGTTLQVEAIKKGVANVIAITAAIRERLTPITDALSRLWDAVKKLVVTMKPLFIVVGVLTGLFLAFFAGLGPVIVLLGALYLAFKVLSPILVALIPVFKALWWVFKHLTPLGILMVGTWKLLVGSFNMFLKFVDGIAGAIDLITSGIERGTDNLTKSINKFSQFIADVISFVWDMLKMHPLYQIYEKGGQAKTGLANASVAMQPAAILESLASLASAAPNLGKQAARSAMSSQGSPRNQTASVGGANGKRVNAQVGVDGSLTIPFNIANFANIFAELATYTGE